MSAFQVWIRPLGEACRIRVDGMENGRWLLARIVDSVGAGSCQPIREEGPVNSFSFQVAYSPTITRSILGELLTGIPEVKLMCQPA